MTECTSIKIDATFLLWELPFFVSFAIVCEMKRFVLSYVILLEIPHWKEDLIIILRDVIIKLRLLKVIDQRGNGKHTIEVVIISRIVPTWGECMNFRNKELRDWWDNRVEFSKGICPWWINKGLHIFCYCYY